MVTLEAPESIVTGKPFEVSFRTESRVSGRLRLTAGTEAVDFTLVRDGREPVPGNGQRLRGKSGSFIVADWGEHAIGDELVLRFEGAKAWLRVVGAP